MLALTPARAAAGWPVAVTGIVTAADPNWGGQFFVQDDSAGIFVDYRDGAAPRPGDRVLVRGRTHPGEFAPIISYPHWTLLGHAGLPPAPLVAADALMAGTQDSQRIAVTGIVRRADPDRALWRLTLAVDGFRLTAFTPPVADTTPDHLIGARLRLRGTAATNYHEPLRQLLDVRLHVPRPDDVEILALETTDPFTTSAVPLASVAQYRYDSAPYRRVHVRGVLTLQRIGRDLFIQDDTGGLRLESVAATAFAPGTVIDAVGFVEYDNHLPVLRDATLRPLGPGALPTALAVPTADLRRGLHHGERLRLSGQVLDQTTRPLPAVGGAPERRQTSWLIQVEDLVCSVAWEAPPHPPATDADAASFPALGSLVQIEGVCDATLDATGHLTHLQLLLARPADLRVLAAPAWWTPRRLGLALAAAAAALGLALVWSWHHIRQNRRLRDLLREIGLARDALRQANDSLEQKVAARTAALQVEMTARKADELQFKGALTERTRLAQELHDSLEQTLTGVALRLNTATKVAARDPAGATTHLQTARHLLHQSQVDLRRSIWDLRSRELEQFDLATALRHCAESLAAAAALTCTCELSTPPDGWPEVVEANVLRIGQEALTNIAKHAQARHVQLRLTADAHTLTLEIRDDGIGFTCADAAALGGLGHFGVIGMQERAKRLTATLTLDSTPGHGTTVRLIVPRGPEPLTA